MRIFVIGLAVLLIVEIGGLLFADRSYLHGDVAGIKVIKVVQDVKKLITNLKIPLDSSA